MDGFGREKIRRIPPPKGGVKTWLSPWGTACEKKEIFL